MDAALTLRRSRVQIPSDPLNPAECIVSMTNIMKDVTASLIVLFVVGLMIPSAFAENVTEWVKNTAGWWATDQILDAAFLTGIQYLIKEGIMVIPPTET